MTLEILPPELTAAKDTIETREPQPYFKPSSSKMESQKSSDCSDATKLDTLSLVGSTLRRPGVLTASCVLMAMLLHALILDSLTILQEKPIGPSQIVPRLTEPSSSPDASLRGLHLQPHVEG